ncbi:MAG TPA: hypothetical protein VFE58_14085 [Tepidisphaeraceae bacterium]|jgi:type II secretory pathway pseudopilin PulG|nr:hypothetical protein [Tepidisphaeraceae bacterium]
MRHNFAARYRRVRGFTLVEAAFVTVVVGLSCAALIQLLAAGTVANVDAAAMTSGVNLANNIHEATLPMTFSQVLALDGQNYSPPVDSRAQPVTGMGTNWKQHVDVKYVQPQSISVLSVNNAVTTAARVTVTVSHENIAIYSTSWVVSNVP